MHLSTSTKVLDNYRVLCSPVCQLVSRGPGSADDAEAWGGGGGPAGLLLQTTVLVPQGDERLETLLKLGRLHPADRRVVMHVGLMTQAPNHVGNVLLQIR